MNMPLFTETRAVETSAPVGPTKDFYDDMREDFQSILKDYGDTLKRLDVAQKKAVRCEILENEIEELKTRNKSLALENEQLEYEMQLTVKEMDNLRVIANTYKEKHMAALRTNESLQSKLDETKEKISEVQELASDMEEKIQQVRIEERTKSKTERAETLRLEDYVRSLQAEREEMQTEISRLRRRLNKYHKRSNSVTSVDSEKTKLRRNSRRSTSSSEKSKRQEEREESLGPYGERRIHGSISDKGSVHPHSLSLLGVGNASVPSKRYSFGCSHSNDFNSSSLMSALEKQLGPKCQMAKGKTYRKISTEQILRYGLAIVESSENKRSCPSLESLLIQEQLKEKQPKRSSRSQKDSDSSSKKSNRPRNSRALAA